MTLTNYFCVVFFFFLVIQHVFEAISWKWKQIKVTKCQQLGTTYDYYRTDRLVTLIIRCSLLKKKTDGRTILNMYAYIDDWLEWVVRCSNDISQKSKCIQIKLTSKGGNLSSKHSFHTIHTNDGFQYQSKIKSNRNTEW